MAKTTILLEDETKALLTEQGKMLESFDSLIRRLLKELEAFRNGAKPE